MLGFVSRSRSTQIRSEIGLLQIRYLPGLS